MKPVASEARVTRRSPGTRLLRAGVIAFAAVVISWLAVEALNNALSLVDLTVYRDGGLIVRHVRPYYDPGSYAPLYDWGGFSALALKFTYTPFAAITFAVVSVLPWGALVASSVVVNMAALLAALWFTFGGLGYTDRRVRLGATLLAAAATFWLQPVVRTIYLGQINLILMAAIIWDLCQPDLRADGRRRWWKGALTGVAAGIKLVPLVFVPYLLITRRFREAAATVAGFAVTVAAGSVAAGQDPWIAAAVVALALGLTAAYLLDRAGYPVPALLATALTGLLASPISWDHHWVWIAPAVAVTGHYALVAARRPHEAGGGRRTAGLLWALAAGMIFFFAAWPDALWENARNLGNFSLGFLWAQPNTNPIKFAQYGDQPSYVEYHWHGFQLLWGNAYILAGVALLAILLGLGWRLARRGQAASAAAPSEELSATIPAGGSPALSRR